MTEEKLIAHYMITLVAKIGQRMDHPKEEMTLDEWLVGRRHHHTEYSIPELSRVVERDSIKITVLIPAKEVAKTIAKVLQVTVGPLAIAKIVTDVFVIDVLSKDHTAEVAAANGARILQRNEIAVEMGPSQGKGDGMWRALQKTKGDIVAFLDGDTSDPSPAHLAGILGPLIMDKEIHMVRGCFDRPFTNALGDSVPHEGGRVTEMLARPLLNLHYPELVGFAQPLAGEFAARRSLLEKLPFPVGYGVEIGTLIDSCKSVGLDGLAQVNLGTRQNEHRPLRELTKTAYAVLCALELRRQTKIVDQLYLPWMGEHYSVPVMERPPVAEYRDRSKSSLGTRFLRLT